MKKNIGSILMVLVFLVGMLISCGGGGSGSGSTGSTSNNTSNTTETTPYDIRGTWKSDVENGTYHIFTLEGTPTGGNLTGQYYGGDYSWHYDGTYVVDGIKVDWIYYCVEIGKKEPISFLGHFVDKDTIACDSTEVIDRYGHVYASSGGYLHRLSN